MPEIDTRAVDTLFRAYSGAVPGASVIVIRDGAVLLRRAYGLANLEHHTPAAPTTDFRLASLSKQFTAMAIMLLVRDGKLRYDQRVSELLPELPPTTRAITIRHFLNHTSGIWDYEELIPETRTAQLDDHDVLALVAAKDSVYFSAGSAYRYSNSAYVLLGIIVARASAMPLPEFMRRRHRAAARVRVFAERRDVRADGSERHERDVGRRRHLHECRRHETMGSRALDGSAR